eukprot:4644392-Pleurochrysis_carterae.AAC.1
MPTPWDVQPTLSTLAPTLAPSASALRFPSCPSARGTLLPQDSANAAAARARARFLPISQMRSQLS